MVTLEQVKLLESKVAKAIEYVNRVSGENAALKEKLEGRQKRIDELEGLVRRFKEDQIRIEEGIVSALERLNQFEDAIEKSISTAAAGMDREGTPPEASKLSGPGNPVSGGVPPAEPVKPSVPSMFETPEEEPPGEEAEEPEDAEPRTGGELDIF
jgi:hypothetical protein